MSSMNTFRFTRDKSGGSVLNTLGAVGKGRRQATEHTIALVKMRQDCRVKSFEVASVEIYLRLAVPTQVTIT